METAVDRVEVEETTMGRVWVDVEEEETAVDLEEDVQETTVDLEIAMDLEVVLVEDRVEVRDLEVMLVEETALQVVKT